MNRKTKNSRLAQDLREWAWIVGLLLAGLACLIARDWIVAATA